MKDNTNGKIKVGIGLLGIFAVLASALRGQTKPDTRTTTDASTFATAPHGGGAVSPQPRNTGVLAPNKGGSTPPPPQPKKPIAKPASVRPAPKPQPQPKPAPQPAPQPAPKKKVTASQRSSMIGPIQYTGKKPPFNYDRHFTQNKAYQIMVANGANTHDMWIYDKAKRTVKHTLVRRKLPYAYVVHWYTGKISRGVKKK